MDANTILIVEDEKEMAEGLRDFFEFSGFKVKTSPDCKSAKKLLKENEFNLIILDLMLPDCDGIKLCSEIKERYSHIPVIILTAKGREIDVIRGFDAGADDYVKKPFSLNELLARVKAAMRRSKSEERVFSEKFVFKNFTFDPKREILRKENREIQLTHLESELLKYFIINKNRVISREELLKEVWKIIPTPGNRNIDNYIVKLRKKIEDNYKKPEHILTIYGQGYKFIV